MQPRTSLLHNSMIPIREELNTEASSPSKSPLRKHASRPSREMTAFTPKTGIASPMGIGLMSPVGWSGSIQDKGFTSAFTPASKFGNGAGRRKNKTRTEIKEEAEETGKTPGGNNKPQISCDYSSLIMCFPENIISMSAKNSNKPFNAFSDLVKTTSNKYDSKRLEDILKANVIAKTAPQGIDDNNVDKRELMKKVLEYNKIQKSHYMKQMSAEKRNILLPLIKSVKNKAKNPPHVKVLPSRKLYEDNGAVEMVAEDRTSLAQSQIVSQPVPMPKQSLSSSASASALLTRNVSESKTSVLLRAYEDKGYEQPISIKNYRVYWTLSPVVDHTWRPDVREGHTFTTVGKQIILYGGLSASLLDEIATYDPVRNQWERPHVTGDIPLSGRHGHSACEYKKSLFIFGGEHQFNPTLNIRECLNDTRMFIPEKNEWKYIKTANQIMSRRHHAATIHNHSMIVYGGINSEGHYMKDIWALNLRTFSWDKVDITGDKEHGIAFHSMSACYLDRANVSSKDKDRQKIAEEGIYVFGGKNTDGKILSTLRIFTLDSKTPQWSYPITKGTPPTARYNHTSLFYEPLGLFIIYGGRNDHLFESSNDICLNDIRILSLDNMMWSQVTSHGDVPKVGRYRHAVASFGSRMLIFGGVEFHKYADDEVKSVELNQARIRKMVMDLDGEMSHDRSKSMSESLPPMNREHKRKTPEPLSVPSAKPLKRIVSFLPIPGNRQQSDAVIEDQVLKPTHDLTAQERNILSRLG